MKLPLKIKNLNYFKKFNIPKYIFFKVIDFNKDQDKILIKIKKNFKKKIIIRSAHFGEDSNFSNAGKFLSIGDINVKYNFKIIKAINDVANSYPDKNKNNQFILVQEMVTDSKYNGVIFTKDPKNNLPLTTINLIENKKTHLITSGSESGITISYYNFLKFVKIKKFNDLINFSNKLSKIKIPENKDIEFVKNSKNKFYLLQARKLLINKKETINKLEDKLNAVKNKIKKLIYEKNDLFGKKTAFSNMTDWNPAEIIGLKPKMLSYSLYQNLITDDIWSESRSELGYNHVKGKPLMFSFLGSPYINIKTDFNSFIPNELSKKTKEKIYNFYIKKYNSDPDYYFDKIESKIILSSSDFSLNKKLFLLKKNNFSNTELKDIKKNLNSITFDCIKNLDSNVEKYKKLEKQLNQIQNDVSSNSINKIFNLINVTKNLGTLPFANLARMAFISVNFLDSMIEIKIITKQNKEDFISSLETISKEISKNIKTFSKKKFIKSYGHIRPDTYEITKKNYSQAYNSYFKKNQKDKINKIKKFKFSNKQKKQIQVYLNNNLPGVSVDQFIYFLKSSIIEREKSKFEFSKGINFIFNEINNLCKRCKINKADATHININTLKELYNNFNFKSLKRKLLSDIQYNKEQHEINSKIKMPNTINHENDILFKIQKSQVGNFFGDGTIEGKIILINKNNLKNLDNKIVCIENADPGYDFIFTHKIKGLITAYGGPNSHMSIRCNEYKLPAIIGLGISKFNEIINSKNVIIDFNNKKISYEKN